MSKRLISSFTKPKKQRLNEGISVKLNGEPISEVTSPKYPGIFIDHKLTFKPHIDYITTKLSRGNTLVARLRHFLTQELLTNFYYANFQSHINYGVIAWTSTAKSYIEQIDKLQRKCIGLITFSKVNDANVNQLFSKCKILPLNKFISMARCAFIWKVVHNQFDEYFTSKFSDLVRRSDFLLTRKFVTPSRDTSAGLNFVTFTSIKQWNRLSPNITQLKSIRCFKRDTKKFLSGK